MRASLPALAGVLLSGCIGPPYEMYWDDPAAAPNVSSVSPDHADSLLAGGEITLQGTKLANTRTVIIGGRNAEVLFASNSEVIVSLPAGPAGGGVVDVVLVTQQGFHRAEGAFNWDIPGSDTWADETVSAMVRRYDYSPDYSCWDVTTQGGVDQWTCSIDVGFVDGEGFAGGAGQPGVAAELAVVGRLADLPPPGEVAILGPGDVPAGAPRVYGVHAVGEALGFTIARDLARDLEAAAGVQAEVEANYPWSDAFTGWSGPVAYLYDDWVCYADELNVLDMDGDVLTVDGDATGATGLALGTVADEEYEAEVYYNEVLFASARVDADGDTLVAGPSGVILAYDDWSGGFLASNAAGYGARADLPANTDIDVWRRQGGYREDFGTIDGMSPLADLSPDPRAGSTATRADGLTVQWAPSDDPDSIVVVELTVYDPTLDDPNGWAVARRLVVQGDEDDGTATFPAEALEQVPAALGEMNDNGDPVGFHAYLTVTRHGLRRVPLPEGGAMVVDLVHGVEGPLTLR
jgi:hypothetical protein